MFELRGRPGPRHFFGRGQLAERAKHQLQSREIGPALHEFAGGVKVQHRLQREVRAVAFLGVNALITRQEFSGLFRNFLIDKNMRGRARALCICFADADADAEEVEEGPRMGLFPNDSRTFVGFSPPPVLFCFV